MVDVGLEPTTQKTHVDDAICLGISGVLVRLTTSKRLTSSLPKLSLITLPRTTKCTLTFFSYFRFDCYRLIVLPGIRHNFIPIGSCLIFKLLLSTGQL